MRSGYRPICRFMAAPGEEIHVGMCQVELVDVDQVHPGESVKALLRFAPGGDAMVRDLVGVSAEVVLLEGERVIGHARVTAID